MVEKNRRGLLEKLILPSNPGKLGFVLASGLHNRYGVVSVRAKHSTREWRITGSNPNFAYEELESPADSCRSGSDPLSGFCSA